MRMNGLKMFLGTQRDKSLREGPMAKWGIVKSSDLFNTKSWSPRDLLKNMEEKGFQCVACNRVKAGLPHEFVQLPYGGFFENPVCSDGCKLKLTEG